MKAVITLLTLLIGMTIGLTTYAENLSISAIDQTNPDEHVTTVPNFVTVPVTIPVISSDETEMDYDFFSEDEC